MLSPFPRITCWLISLFGLIILLIAPNFSRAQDTIVPPRAPTLDTTMQAGEAAAAEPQRKFIRWNEFDGKFLTIRAGVGFLYEGATYIQDDNSKEQNDLEPDGKVRDFRFMLRGRFKFKRPVTWSCGIMYDGPTKEWLFRETGIMVGVPEIKSHFFIGRTKEGFSLNKVMVGYAGWTMERATMSDATVPILGDGIKWLGYVPKWHLLWNIGYFIDSYNKRQSFSTYKNQFVARIAWLPIISENSPNLLHIGLNSRFGQVDDGMLQLRARPENNVAPFFLDTGDFPAEKTAMAGGEVYYRRGSWLFGSEYWFQETQSPETGHPVFHGGDIVTTWLITGETRTYNTVGGFFKQVSPNRTVFEGGPGAWEAVLRFSYIDLDDAAITGGKFWRITPMVNWYLSDQLRLELAYGYGKLYRFDLTGGTHFFQSRIQIWL